MHIKSQTEMKAEAMYRICNMPFPKDIKTAFCEQGVIKMSYKDKICNLDRHARFVVDSINSAGGEFIYHALKEGDTYILFVVSIDADDWEKERYKHDKIPMRVMIDYPQAIDYEFEKIHVGFKGGVPYTV